MLFNRLILAAGLFAASAVFADHFPAAKGNWWKFGYVYTSSSWGNAYRESGTTVWEIADYEVMKTPLVPGHEQIRIVIRTTKNTQQRTYAPNPRDKRNGALSWDSLYDPPRVARDSLVLRGLRGVNGLWRQDDSCWMFVHNPADSIPKERLAVTPVSMELDGRNVTGVKVDPQQCTGLFEHGVWYVTVDNVGPVASHGSSSPLIMDWSSDDSMWLVQTNVGSTEARRALSAPPGPRARMPAGRTIYGLDGRPRRLPRSGIFVTVNGDRIIQRTGFGL